jgi:polyribonucleotide nucleotidyltransferase
MFNITKKSIALPDGRVIEIETGKLARQADGAVVLKMGDTMLLATIVSVPDAKDGVDFMPLSVDYQEKFGSVGRIPGGFTRRETKLSDYEVLVSRLVDRALRPLFYSDYHSETQINIHLISADADTQPDALAAFAASCAIAVSDIPIEDYISEVRVGRVEGKWIINPTFSQMKNSDIDLMIGASYSNILMVEGELHEVSEEDMIEAIRQGHEVIKTQCTLQKELAEAVGKTEKRTYNHEKQDETLEKRIKEEVYPLLYAHASLASDNKNIRGEGFKKIKTEFVEKLKTEATEKGEDFKIDNYVFERYFSKIKKKACRDFTLKSKKRLDGRAYNEIRPITCEVGYLPSTHGSAIFTRGETQSLTTVTLGTKLDEQIIDGAMIEGYNRFMLHYNFPSFSTGEARPNRAPGRREIGHGNLALRALKNMIPPHGEQYPYTTRIVSDILESNGSSSMATVCAGTLALMDAGVQIKAPVAGIAMGLISDSETGEYAVLSDILGDEDHLGDMDFKVTGTTKGITACQMDIKVDGLSFEVLKQALQQAKEGRLHILKKITDAIAQPNADYKPQVPRAEIMRIPQEMIGAVIGPGGKVIQDIQKTSGATINIEERDGAGYVSVFAMNKESMAMAVNRIKGITTLPELNKVYEGRVKGIHAFGAFVEFMPGKDGLLPIGEVKWERVEDLSKILEVGEEITVKLIGIEPNGKFKLSRKVLIPRS